MRWMQRRQMMRKQPRCRRRRLRELPADQNVLFFRVASHFDCRRENLCTRGARYLCSGDKLIHEKCAPRSPVRSKPKARELMRVKSQNMNAQDGEERSALLRK